MQLEFEGEVIHWRGPSPHYFVAVPEPLCADLRVAAPPCPWTPEGSARQPAVFGQRARATRPSSHTGSVDS